MPDQRLSFAASLKRLLLVSVVFVVLYRLSNRLTHGRTDIGQARFDWEQHIPFVDWSVLPYLSIIGFFIASFFVTAGRAALDRHCRRLLLVLAIALVCYAILPLRFGFERPAVTGILSPLYAGLSAFDMPYNRAPSLHIAVLVLLWVQLAPQRSSLERRLLGTWFGLIAVTRPRAVASASPSGVPTRRRPRRVLPPFALLDGAQP
jgi:hypothetical protein